MINCIHVDSLIMRNKLIGQSLPQNMEIELNLRKHAFLVNFSKLFDLFRPYLADSVVTIYHTKSI